MRKAAIAILKSLGIAALSLAVAACGSRQELRLPKDSKPVPAAYGTTGARSAYDMMQPPVQARPEGGAEPLQHSQERSPDHFDLPPEG